MQKYAWILAIIVGLVFFFILEYVHDITFDTERAEAVPLASVLNSELASLEALRKSHVKDLLKSLQSPDPSLEPAQYENYYQYAVLASFHEYLRIWILEASIDEKKLLNRRYDAAQALAVSTTHLGKLFMLVAKPTPLDEFLESSPSLSADQQQAFDNYRELKNMALRISHHWGKSLKAYDDLYFNNSEEIADEYLHPELQQLNIAWKGLSEDVTAFTNCFEDERPLAVDKDFVVSDFLKLIRMMYIVQQNRVRIADPLSNALNFSVLATARPSFSLRQFLERTLEHAQQLDQEPASEFPELARIAEAKASSPMIATYLEQFSDCFDQGKELSARYQEILASHLANTKPQSP